MPQSLSAIYVHLVFSTKNRNPFLSDPDVRQQMHRYMQEVTKRLDCPALALNGTADHVHLLARLPRTLTVAEWTKEVKRATSTWMKATNSDFAWQAGYGAFSCSSSELDRICTYIRGQEEHHRVLSFQEEYLALLAEAGIEWDERYIWE